MPAQLGRDDVNSKEFGYYGRDGTRKNRRVIDMEAFGDRNRLHRLDPNKLREFVEDEDDAQRMGIDLSETTDKDGKKGRADISKDVGIWRPSRQPSSAMISAASGEPRPGWRAAGSSNRGSLNCFPKPDSCNHALIFAQVALSRPTPKIRLYLPSAAM